mmetsp:Transcript_22089/g.66375  ORF Transcript_22089/g.66375 Transcript_22089/m.66375 type:complete len:233 (+) Transcript_22089:1542-2240(+)
MRLGEAAGSNAADGPPVHSYLPEAPPLEEFHDRIPISGHRRCRGVPLGAAKPTVVKQEDAAALRQVEVQPVGLVGHGLVVPCVWVAPDDHGAARCITRLIDEFLEGNILLAVGTRQRVVLGRHLSGSPTAPECLARDEHPIDHAAVGGPNPAVGPGVAHQQLGPHLVQGTHRGHAHEAPRAGAAAILLAVKAVEEHRQLLQALDAGARPGLRLHNERGIRDRVVQRHRYQAL